MLDHIMLLLVAGGHYDHGGNNATGTATGAGGVPGMIIVSIYFLLILALVVVGFIPYLWLHLILLQPTAVLLHLLFAAADHDRQSLVAVSTPSVTTQTLSTLMAFFMLKL